MILNDAINKLDLTDIYRTFHRKTAEYTFFSSAHGTFSKIDHILGHKIILHNYKRMEITSSYFSNCNGMKLEINYKKKNEKRTNISTLNNMLINKNGSMKKSKRKSENTFRQRKIETQLSKIYGMQQKQF